VQAKKQEVEARQRVADSIQAEKDAEQRLADARKQAAAGSGGGGGGAAQQITQLAPAARAFLNTIIGLRPAFTALRLDVQQKLFAGLSGPIRGLAEKWLPTLHSVLGGFASTFNDIGKTAISSLGKTTLIQNMAAGANSFRKALGEVGKAAGGPLVDAFGRLARASGPFLEKVGHLLAGVITDFSAWIKKADDSGKLDKFFKDAADTLEKVWNVGKNVVKIIGQFIGIIFPQASSTGNSALDGANITLGRISKWLDDPKHQETIRRLISDVGDFIGVLWKVGTAGPKAFGAIATGVKNAYNWVVSTGSKIVGWVKALPGRIAKASVGMWDGFKTAFKSALNWVIGKWNNLHFTMPGFLGGGTIGMPSVNYLAQGGIVPATPGGRLAVLGEGGRDEAVIPLPKGGSMPLAAAPAGGVQEVRIKLDFGDSEMGRAMARAVRTQPAVAAAIKSSLKVTVTT
jgi:hypothetical protein